MKYAIGFGLFLLGLFLAKGPVDARRQAAIDEFNARPPEVVAATSTAAAFFPTQVAVRLGFDQSSHFDAQPLAYQITDDDIVKLMVSVHEIGDFHPYSGIQVDIKTISKGAHNTYNLDALISSLQVSLQLLDDSFEVIAEGKHNMSRTKIANTNFSLDDITGLSVESVTAAKFTLEALPGNDLTKVWLVTIEPWP